MTAYWTDPRSGKLMVYRDGKRWHYEGGLEQERGEWVEGDPLPGLYWRLKERVRRAFGFLGEKT